MNELDKQLQEIMINSMKIQAKYEEIKKRTYIQDIEEQITQSKPKEKEICYDVSNEFAYKAFINSLPQEVDSSLFQKVLIQVMDNHSNKKLNGGVRLFKVVDAFIEKYTYEEVYDEDYIAYGYINEYFRTSPARIDFKKYTQHGTKALQDYVKTNLTEDFSNYVEQISTLIMFSQLIKQEKIVLDNITKETSSFLKTFLSTIQVQESNNILSKYNSQDIKNGSFIKELKNAFNDYYFLRNSWRYSSFTNDMKEQIRQNQFEYQLKNIMLYDAQDLHMPEEKIEINTKDLKIYNYIAKAFGLKEEKE